MIMYSLESIYLPWEEGKGEGKGKGKVSTLQAMTIQTGE
jgi:hypothetical protein